MGGNSSSRHVSFEERVTFVKGIRLSERVIDRMKESPPVVCPQATTKPCTQSMTTPPVAPPVEQLVPVPVTEKTSAPPSPVESPEALPVSPAAQPASGKPVDLPVDPETSPSPISIPAPIQSVLEESAVSQSGSASSVVLPEEMPSKTQMGPISTGEPKVPHLSQVEEPVEASLIDQLKAFPPQTCVVNEEKLKNQIREDLQKNLLNEEMKTAERNIQQQLEEEKAKAKVQAQSAARLQIQDEVQKLLEEKALADAIRREQLNVQDERLIAQYYWMEKKAQKLEEMQKDLKNQDNVFREQIAKMQKKMVQFTKVTSENYKKGFEDTHNRFRRYQIKPVCSDLQSQILKCYAENKGQTMSCSNIASLYIQCVDRARQGKKLST
ncbi:coiled-coil-helix-coiled-coil-helix domain containing 3b isoform X2 [Labeo rohita]|uniref:coiled-coil-helix-coiled-coil-helix domain containing 3b isoform X2 n=1 Tax=Labeo rohita TaxID=84645 RepID=UPI0021E1CEDB|nr:coiled-coil-helix-coiled-coil-helix domain containing 3b isoform X2 [Labeo rohita]